MNYTVCVFGTKKPSTPRDTVCLEGLRLSGNSIIECIDDSPSFFKYLKLIKKYWTLRNSCDVIYVPYSNLLAVPLARIISRKKIIFNALAPLYESIVLDRKRHSKYSPAALWYWLLDYISFRAAHIVFIETNAQIDFVAKTFFINKKKLKRVWTSADEHFWKPDHAQGKAKEFTVVFRGYFLPFIGVEIIVEAARLLKDEAINFHIIGRGYLKEKIKKLVSEVNSSRIKLDIGFLEETYLLKSMQEAHISLGQFSSEARGQRTISHKTFETLALGLPFITCESQSGRELLEEGKNCLYTTCDDPRDLAEKIKVLKNNTELQESMGRNNRELFEEKLTAHVLGQEIHGIIQELVGNGK